MTTYRVVIAPKGYGPDDAFANQFLLSDRVVEADSKLDAVMRATAQSHIADFESGSYTVRSVTVVQGQTTVDMAEQRARREVREVGCEYTRDGSTMSMIECARNGCNLCGGELDIAGEDF